MSHSRNEHLPKLMNLYRSYVKQRRTKDLRFKSFSRFHKPDVNKTKI